MTGNSPSLFERDLAVLWHPCTQMKDHERDLPLVPIRRAQGVWLEGFDGRRYLDAISSWWVNLFGHANPVIGAAVARQLAELEHVIFAGFTHEPAVEVAETLLRLAPPGLARCFFADNGSAAIEVAVKMSFHYWRNCGQSRKTRFITLANSYHGETLGALSVTDVALFRAAYGALIRQQATVPTPDWRKALAGESSEEYALRCADHLERHLQQHHARLAAFIIEPLVQGAAGMAMYHPTYLQRARQLCTEHDVHLIADEIAVGMGRTGTMFACEQGTTRPRQDSSQDGQGIVPDFLCLSKGITGGYLPLSVVMTQNKIYQAFYHDEVSSGFLHSHSYTGNPLACRAALATLDIFARDGVLAANRDKAVYLNQVARPLREHPAVLNWRNTGMIWAFEVETSRRNFAQQCYSLALENELLLRPIGNTIYFMPPYIIAQEEIDLLVDRTLRIVNQLS